MKANFYGNYRLLAGVKSLELESGEGWTIRRVVNEIVSGHPDLRKHWLDESGELKAHVHIFFNGGNVRGLPSGLDSAVENTDTLDFFSPTAGG
jgi:molybdopterin synthase sulfur carrier subunit